MEEGNDLENKIFKEKIKNMTPGSDGKVDIKFNGKKGVKVKLEYLQKLKDPIKWIENIHGRKLINRLDKSLARGESVESNTGLISYLTRNGYADKVNEVLTNNEIDEDEWPEDEEGMDESYGVNIPETNDDDNSINIIKI